MGIQKCLEAICEASGGDGSGLYSVESINDLLLVNTTLVKDVNVKRYYADQYYFGGGTFTYDDTLNKSLADGGEYFDPSVDLVSQGTGVGTGLWVRVDTSILTGDEYGLKPGVACDVELQRYINSQENVILNRAYIVNDKLTLKNDTNLIVNGSLSSTSTSKMLLENDIANGFRGSIITKGDGYLANSFAGGTSIVLHSANASVIDFMFRGTPENVLHIIGDAQSNSANDFDELSNVSANDIRRVIVQGEVTNGVILEGVDTAGWIFNNTIGMIKCGNIKNASLCFRGRCNSNTASEVYGYPIVSGAFTVKFEDAPAADWILANTIDKSYAWNNSYVANAGCAYFGAFTHNNSVGCYKDYNLTDIVAHDNCISFNADITSMVFDADGIQNYSKVRQITDTKTSYNSNGIDSIDMAPSDVHVIKMNLSFCLVEFITSAGDYGKFFFNLTNAKYNDTEIFIKKIEGDAIYVENNVVAPLTGDTNAGSITIGVDNDHNIYIDNGSGVDKSFAYITIASKGDATVA